MPFPVVAGEKQKEPDEPLSLSGFFL